MPEEEQPAQPTETPAPSDPAWPFEHFEPRPIEPLPPPETTVPPFTSTDIPGFPDEGEDGGGEGGEEGGEGE